MKRKKNWNMKNWIENKSKSEANRTMERCEVLCYCMLCFWLSFLVCGGYLGMGAAYGTAKSGVGVASMGVMRPELVMKSIVPVVMAGVLGIYGLIIAVIISTGINPKAKSYYLFDGYAHLSSGLSCGLAGLSAGMAIGIVGDAGVRYVSNPLYVLFCACMDWFLLSSFVVY